MIDIGTLLTSVVLALVGAIPTAIVLYLGFVKGTEKTVDTAINKIVERSEKSPTAQRFLKLMEVTDKLFGDEQAIEQITLFFKEARALVTSPEARNFFTQMTTILKQLGGAPSSEEHVFSMPKSSTKVKKNERKKETEV